MTESLIRKTDRDNKMIKYRIKKKGAIAACFLAVMGLMLMGCGSGSTGDGTEKVTPGIESSTGSIDPGSEDGSKKNTPGNESSVGSVTPGSESSAEINASDIEAGTEAVSDAAGLTTDVEQELSASSAGNVPEEQRVVISEILSSNSMYMEHDGDYCDMIELANMSDEDADISGYFISDTLFNPTKARLGGTIPKRGFAVFYCVGEGADIEKNELPFKISASGETIVLAGSEGTIVESVAVPKLEKNTSYARNEEGGFVITEIVTMGEKNVLSDFDPILPEVTPADGTKTSGPLEVTFTPAAGTQLFYTTNGSFPGTSSEKYSDKPIKLNKTTTVRVYVKTTGDASAGEENSVREAYASYTFFLDEPDETLDDFCVAIGAGDLERLNMFPQSSKRYRVSAAMYHEGEKVFDETCGMNANGNTSSVYDKKSYRLKFSKEFGKSELHCKVFDDLNIDSFDSLVLRSGSQDNEDVMMKDELVPVILRQGNLVDEVLTTRYRPVNLYLNGEYRGLYYVREHIDGHMIASHYGCDREDVTVVEQCKEIKCGNAGKEWADLWNFVGENDLRDRDAFDHMASLVSLESVADYYLIQIWLHNIDTDNVRVYKVGNDKWRYALYDLDLTLNDNGTSGPTFMLGKYNRGVYTFNALVYKLLQNPEFMEYFLSRMQLLYTTILSEEKVVPIIDSFVANIEHDMERSCGLWGPHTDSSGGVYYINYSTWKRRVEKFKQRFSGRTAVVASEFVKLKGVDSTLVEKYLSDIIK